MSAAAVAVVGPTAVGKSTFALELVRRVGDLELVSVDSMQVYRGMDLGTAKPTAVEQAEHPVHLIDLVEPDVEFTVAMFQQAYRAMMAELSARGSRPLLVGGTGLYHRAVIDDLELPGQYPEVRAALEAEPDTAALHERLTGLDPLAASRMEPTNRRRVVRALEVCIGSGRAFSSFGPGLDAYPDSPVLQIGLDRARDDLDRRIADRYATQMADGFLDEVRNLAARPGGLSRSAGQALGYRELLGALAGECTVEEAVESAVTRTRRFARRQQRWFRRDPRVRWFPVEPDEKMVSVVDRVLEDCGQCI